MSVKRKPYYTKKKMITEQLINADIRIDGLEKEGNMMEKALEEKNKIILEMFELLERLTDDEPCRVVESSGYCLTHGKFSPCPCQAWRELKQKIGGKK